MLPLLLKRALRQYERHRFLVRIHMASRLRLCLAARTSVSALPQWKSALSARRAATRSCVCTLRLSVLALRLALRQTSFRVLVEEHCRLQVPVAVKQGVSKSPQRVSGGASGKAAAARTRVRRSRSRRPSCRYSSLPNRRCVSIRRCDTATSQCCEQTRHTKTSAHPLNASLVRTTDT